MQAILEDLGEDNSDLDKLLCGIGPNGEGCNKVSGCKNGYEGRHHDHDTRTARQG